MADIALRQVEVYELRRHGRPLEIAQSIAELQKTMAEMDRNGKRFEVVQYQENAGEIVGNVLDWNAGESPPRFKLHWLCPQCEMHEWGELTTDTPNPCLWYSNCGCIDKWLIRFAWPTILESSP